MRVLVCGGRYYNDSARVAKELSSERWTAPITTVIQGGATGADQLAREWAEAQGIPVLEMRADWKKHGRKAGPMRNQSMIDLSAPDLVVAFPGGRGTADMVRRAKKAKIPVWEVENLTQRHVRYGLGMTGCGLVACACDIALFGLPSGLSAAMTAIGIVILLGLV